MGLNILVCVLRFLCKEELMSCCGWCGLHDDVLLLWFTMLMLAADLTLTMLFIVQLLAPIMHIHIK